MLDVDELVTSAGVDQSATDLAPAVARPVYDWEVANQRKKDAVQQLAPLAEALDDVENRIAELVSKVRRLELD